MAISPTQLTQGTNGSLITSTVTPSISPTGDSLILVAVGVYNSDAGSTAVSSVTGNGITYALVASAPAVNGGFGPYQIHLFRGMSASPSAGAITIDPTAPADSGQVDYSVVEFAGAVTGNNGADAVVQSNTTSEANGSSPVSVTLAAFADADNGAYGCANSYNGRNYAPGSGFTMLDESTQVKAEWRADNDTTVDFTWTGGNDHVGLIGIEIAAAAAGGADFPLDAQPGSYALTGVLAGVPAGRIVNAATGAYALTGAAAQIPSSKLFEAAPGSYSLMGVAASPVVGRAVNAEVGVYALTGSAAGLLADRIVVAEPGTYAVTGEAAEFLRDLVVSVDPGAYVITGIDAELAIPGAFVLDAEVGSYAISGAAAAVVVAHFIVAEVGAFSVAGADVGFLRELVISLEAGGYTVTGVAAGLAADVEEPLSFPDGYPPVLVNPGGGRIQAIEIVGVEL